MVKWTVRIDDDHAAVFREFCASSGVSIQGCIEAFVRWTCDSHQGNALRPEPDRPGVDEELTSRWSQFVDVAREIDATRRVRG